MIRIYEPFVAYNQREYLNQCVDENMLTFHGKFEKEFAKRLAEYFGVKHCILTNSGTTALSALYNCIPLKNKRVATSNLTYAATVNQLIMVGANTHVIDIDENGQLDLYKFEKQCKLYSFDALVIPGIYHDSPDMDLAKYLCKKYDVLLFEDSSEVFGGVQSGKLLGTFGTAATFSFFGNKLITCGEGGCVITNDDDLAERIKLFINHNTIGPYVHDGPICSNYRMTNMQAAVGLAQLENIDIILNNKRSIFKFYHKKLPHQLIVPYSYSSHWMNIAYSDNPDLLIKQGKDNNIEFRRIFKPIHLQPNWPQVAYSKMPQSTEFYNNHICLPSGPNLTLEQLNKVVEVYENCENP